MQYECEPLDLYLNLDSLNSVQNQKNLVNFQYWKWAKKGTLKIQKSQIAILVLNQCPISAVFPIVRFAGDQKTALTGESL